MDNTYNYWCQDCTCSKNPKGKDFQITKDSEDENKAEFCPNNNSELKLMGESINILASFSSKTPDEKRAILKKRAREHNNKFNSSKDVKTTI